MADVKGMGEFRSSLSSILATLRDAPKPETVHLGSHRREEAGLPSRERYEQEVAAMLELEELERFGALAFVRARLADSRLAEGTVARLPHGQQERGVESREFRGEG